MVMNKTTVANKVNFGRIYGDASCPSYITPEGPVWMYRKGQKVRFFTAEGVQVGPEQNNVGPAVVAAAAAGWIDPSLPSWFNAGFTAHVRASSVSTSRRAA